MIPISVKGGSLSHFCSGRLSLWLLLLTSLTACRAIPDNYGILFTTGPITAARAARQTTPPVAKTVKSHSLYMAPITIGIRRSDSDPKLMALHGVKVGTSRGWEQFARAAIWNVIRQNLGGSVHLVGAPKQASIILQIEANLDCPAKSEHLLFNLNTKLLAGKDVLHTANYPVRLPGSCTVRVRTIGDERVQDARNKMATTIIEAITSSSSALMADLTPVLRKYSPRFVQRVRAEKDGTRRFLAILPFRALNKKIHPHVIRVITEETRVLAHQSGMFKVINREDQRQLIAKMNENLRTCKSEICQLEIGKMLSADSLVLGEIRKAGDKIRVRVKVLDLARGVVLAFSEVTLAHELATALPDYRAFLKKAIRKIK